MSGERKHIRVWQDSQKDNSLDQFMHSLQFQLKF